MEYLLKASGLVLILFLFYALVLKNETFFTSIRTYFIFSLLLVLIVPLLEIPIYIEKVSSQISQINYSEITTSSISSNSIEWTTILTFLYLIGVAIFSLRFLIQLTSLLNLIVNKKLNKQGKYYFLETSKDISPFSFFNIIIYNKTQFSTKELELIIEHEKVHAQQWHSIDTLLSHLLVILLWFNPFVWLFKKAVQQNLEFLADAKALEQAKDHKLYQLTLLKTSGAQFCTEITNNFYNSLLKKRIIMLQKNKSTMKNQWKYTLLIPILLAFVFAFNTKTIAQEKKLMELDGVSKLEVTLTIDKNSTNEKLNKEAAFFNKEFDITVKFKGIKRNATDEITAIKITAKGDGIASTFQKSGTNPIHPIRISYERESNNFTIGNVARNEIMGIHELHTKANTFYAKKSDSLGNFYTVTSTYYSDDDLESKLDSLPYSEEKEIIINGKKQKFWIHKLGEKLISNDKITEIQLEIKDLDSLKVLNVNDEDNASENIFIIKTDDNKFSEQKIVKKENIVLRSSNNDKPLVIVDGKERSSKEMKEISPDSIEKVEVLKGKSAIDKFGEKGKNGVILITTKKS